MNCNTTHYRANSSSVPGDPLESTCRHASLSWHLQKLQQMQIMLQFWELLVMKYVIVHYAVY
ncbi:hypothetical protein EYS10_02530 (plasmid) [Rahnella aquatilis]|nr:hypothetical protein EYS10_02530 [Rahnella aquatilis]